jgi:hypothetical protein
VFYAYINLLGSATCSEWFERYNSQIVSDIIIIITLISSFRPLPYKSLLPHVSAAIQLSNDTGKHPIKGDTIQYVYTNSQHNNPLCRVIPIAIGNAQKESLSQYDKEKYREMILDASETVLGLFGFDRTVYSQFKKKEIGKWYDEL